jgi:mRNA-degrading endonuclease toxin of MazEF toxin-antitoxin module
MSKLEELKKEAAELGITHSANITEATLQKKIDEHYSAGEEQAAKELSEAVAQVAAAEPKKAKVAAKYADLATAMEAEARKTKIVTIIDNDQRENNQTTTCVVNCSNEYFDLGTMVLPLNMEVEVMQGHLNVLLENKIPFHTRIKDGLSSVTMRPRYTISYSDKTKLD